MNRPILATLSACESFTFRMRLSSLFFRPSLLSALLLLSATALLSATSVTYPGYGNATLEEGSIEIWLVPLADFSLKEDGGKGQVLFQFLELSTANNFTCSASWTQNGNKGLFRVRCQGPNDTMLPLSEDKRVAPQWSKDQPSTMALVWKDHWMGFYLDGKLYKERTQNAGITGNLSDLTIRLGNSGKNGRPWLFQGIRVSSVARTPEELAASTMTADAATLLLDIGNDWKNLSKQTQPRIIANIAGQPMAGVIDGAITLQKGKDSQGLVIQ